MSLFNQGRLISIFLEGLRNKLLHAHLFAKRHVSFNDWCLDAMDYDDNFDMSSISRQESKREDKSTSSKGTHSSIPSINHDQIVDQVLRKMGQMYCPSFRPQQYKNQPYNNQAPSQGPYQCGICSGPYKSEACHQFQSTLRHVPTKQWCNYCRWNFSHISPECNHLAKMRREQITSTPMNPMRPGGNFERNTVPQEQAHPVLGAQPPARGTATFRYVRIEEPEASLAMVFSQPYYNEEDYPLFARLVEASIGSNALSENYGNKANPLLLLGPNPYPRNTKPGKIYPPQQSSPIICFGCGDDHYVRDYPDKKLVAEPPKPRGGTKGNQTSDPQPRRIQLKQKRSFQFLTTDQEDHPWLIKSMSHFKQ